MNTIGLLLVLGLAFFALKQKSEKTRNMLLIASALLGFCMFSAEGFMVSHNTAGTCIEAASPPVDADTTACGEVSALNDAAACNLVMTAADSTVQACTYAVGTLDSPIELAATDLPLLFPSCLGGKQVKASGGTLGSMCEDATTGSVTWENICGPGAECDGSIEYFGASALAEDKSNQCGATFNGTWASTCKCTDDDKTWAPGASNECTAPPA